MAITRTTIRDLPDRTEWREDDPTVGYVGFGVDWKPGTPAANRDDLTAKILTALTANQSAQTTNATYLAIASPSNAQNAAQIKALTNQSNALLKECSALIRLLLGKLDDVMGT